ncbi:MAG: pyridoxamine 5'-phosphate oxidase family protein [Ruminococcaceae bacterium]|nr:pyridoxamine 5'-phosphate oxidase family protein [Oscillospiraceae bacterium]
MFRDLTRKKQQLSDKECREILNQEVRGVLAVNGDGGYPYALPINFYFDKTDNKIYFHSGKVGHKLDAIANSNKVSFCVYDQGYHKNGHWSLNVRSVIIFGRVHIVSDWSDDLMLEFSTRFTNDTQYIQNEIKKFRNNTTILCLEIEHMTGKLVNES